jgi:hypothetical protein
MADKNLQAAANGDFARHLLENIKLQPESYTAWNGTIRQWAYTEEERNIGFESCYDCGIPYSALGDCVVSDQIWRLIQPRPVAEEWRGCGLLCANCIIERLHHLKIYGVHAMLW